MSDTAIRVENLGKKYIIDHQQAGGYATLRDKLAGGMQSLKQRLLAPANGKSFNPAKEEFWALKDVSFEVKQGDRLGIIGRNGAGKSTLLKILSRITEPTSGQITIQGRVASLLEVGTGFHPELTGRENIFLNGAILGMSRIEILKKFDEIIEFAEIEKFLDTPVKRYSSGMYMRLAFAVAAHLEPEILIVDEVLAVGDSDFQNKCLQKMQTINREGRTVLFVSHNMAAVKQLCNSALFLVKGEIILLGRSEDVVTKYLNTQASTLSIPKEINKYGLQILDILIQDSKTFDVTNHLIFDEDYIFKFCLHAHQKITRTCFVTRIYNASGLLVSSICSVEEGIHPFTAEGTVEIKCFLSKIQLFPGKYTMSIFIYRPEEATAYLEADSILSFEVEPSILKNAMWPYRNDHGCVRISDSITVTQR